MEFDMEVWERYENLKKEVYLKYGYTNKADSEIRKIIERMGL